MGNRHAKSSVSSPAASTPTPSSSGSSSSEASSSPAPAPIAKIAQWKWEDDSSAHKANLKFTAYDAETNAIIEMAYSEGKDSVELSHGYFGASGGYRIDFKKLQQVKLNTGFVRAIERTEFDRASKKTTVLSQSRATSGNGIKLDEKGLYKLDEKDLERLIDPDAEGFEKPEDTKTLLAKKLTHWRSAKPSEHDCCICLCPLDEKHVKLKCNHEFHQDCIVHCLKDGYLVCPSCQIVYGIRKGTMPNGTMNVQRRSNEKCDGYSDCGSIVINYSFPSGKQEHPNPGANYSGTSRTAYLPDNKEGNEVLKLLQVAFDRKLTFRIGTSVTTGENNAVVWNGIHHKTSRTGGATNWGFPDPDYFSRVKEELSAIGVKTFEED